MLCITRRERMSYIILGGLDHLQVSASFPPSSQYRIVLSWDLLAWMSVKDGIFSSFTNFITTPELSGSLYIMPDIYHAQITEYSLETIYRRNHSQWDLFSLHEHIPDCYSVRPSPFYRCFLASDYLNPNTNWSFRKHLSYALPTEMIFYLLRSIHTKCLIRDYSAGLMLDTLEIIIKWLQVGVSESCKRQTQTKNPNCVQGLGSERPSDLYDRFQAELFRLPLECLNSDFEV